MTKVNMYKAGSASVVIRCQNLEASRCFYELLGFKLKKEQHPHGPVHYSFKVNKVLYELYPAKKGPKPHQHLKLFMEYPPLKRLIRNDRLPLEIQDHIRTKWGKSNEEYVDLVIDLDGNRIVITD